MDFSYSDEQRMLKDMVDRVVADQYSFEQREKIIKSDTGYSPEVWSQFAELGLLAVPFSEAAGGFDGGGAELMVVAEGFGRGLVVEPYLSTVVLAGTFLDAALDDNAKADALAPIINVIVLNLAYLVVGVVIVEVVFVYPGLGQLLVDSVTMRDIPVVQASALIFAATYIVLNLLADVLSIQAR